MAFKEKDPNGNGKADEIPMLSPSIYRYIRKHDADRHMYVESIDAGNSAVMLKLPDTVENCIYPFSAVSFPTLLK